MTAIGVNYKMLLGDLNVRYIIMRKNKTENSDDDEVILRYIEIAKSLMRDLLF
jgi:hypothetical protein